MTEHAVGTERMDTPGASAGSQAESAPKLAAMITSPEAGLPHMAPTYAPTGFTLLDDLLARADELTHGKAGLLQRTVSYLIIGGTAAVVNLVCLWLFLDVLLVGLPLGPRYVIAQIIATEVSILANFIPNDYYTFNRLPGHARTWWVRCLRFHSTTLVGVAVTLSVSFTLFHWFGLAPLVAQAIAILIGLVFNFTLHHVWTYRHL
jgi:putative flippase GtrA